ncbi:alpha/beta hydrolase fold family protein [Pseudarthrobacter siccitolerans]|uniref:Alpha/beta hydrolase fold family protein n=1 Tax=Pseudarthrobacter siccitolerans TaxID=861266 RepID=A0A024H0G2_9MICC|nr:alpha/beta fold hydrolase [Pseudarthrobacter siccitolerans]CCQ45231.1 alpha/beta hydrolase fold family protein [Pseudarthrobacter siccitolerans]
MDAVEVAGLRIAYQRAGSGPPLVLFHGAGEDSRIWRQQLEDLSRDFTVIAWDAPGCGQSDDPAPDLSARDLGLLAAGFVEQAVRGTGKPHLLGLSWGSMVALELYKGYPDVPASLLLVSAYAGWAGSLPPEEVDRRIAMVEAEIGEPPGKFVNEWLPTLFTPRADPAVVAEIAAIMLDVRPASLRALLSASGRADYRDLLPAIAVPTLLIYGEEDQRSPLPVARELHRQIPGAELTVIPAAGHLVFAEAPEAFNAEVRRFLQGLA